MLDRQRDRLDWWLTPVARPLRHVNPDVFTWLSLLAAAVAGIAFWQSSADRLGLLVLGSAMVAANGILDIMDGKIAKMTGKASPRGDYLDHAVDRFSDVFILLGLALSEWTHPEIGMLAVVFTLLTSYLGTQAQAVGIGRNYGGWLGRADRMVLLIAVPLLTVLLQTYGITAFNVPGTSLLTTAPEAMLAYFAAAGVVATLQRFTKGLRGFDRDGKIK